MNKNYRKALALCLAAGILLPGCGTAGGSDSTQTTVSESLAVDATDTGNSGQETTEDSRDLFAMDTYMTLKAYGTNASKALDAATAEIERLDALFSVGNADSEVSILNESGSEILSEETAFLMKTSLELYKTTEGAFDIAIYPLMEEWGFTTQDYKVPEEKTIRKLLKYTDASEIEFDESSSLAALPSDMAIDFGGIAKGYTSAKVMDIFKEYDVDCGIVSLGGNVQTYKKKPDGSEWNVAIQNPDESGDYIGTVRVSDKAVITSGGYERYFEENGVTYHHILDPATGYPAESGLTSVSIISPQGTTSDGLSTAMFVMGKERALKFWKENHEKYDFDMILVSDDGSITITEGLEDSFSSTFEYTVAKY